MAAAYRLTVTQEPSRSGQAGGQVRGKGERLSKSTAIKVKVRITPNLIKRTYLHSRPLEGQSTVGNSPAVIPVLSIINDIHFQFCTH